MARHSEYRAPTTVIDRKVNDRAEKQHNAHAQRTVGLEIEPD